ncbi:MAG: hypothetical protein B7X35_00790 [Halothiobacillus sp. 14-56-357]|jgi:hypothetical protein|nr:MAG: hypothetical protein B7X35_00790 [Halothiobacillus sp. 14-56-357]OZB79368.1 MAG: hypothetical protein B7X29_01180 [Halothiobacillus sp. 13-55-115]
MIPNALILSLIVRESLEAELVDQLSALADYPLFLVSNLRGHNDTHHGLSVAEQVEGTAPLIRMSLFTDEATANRIIDHLRAHFPNAGIRWWCIPVESGLIE